MQRPSHRLVVSWLAFGAAGLVAAAALSEALESLVRRYPSDPACAWARLANGKGSIVRCLSEQEASQLAPVANALPVAPAVPIAPTAATSVTTAPSASPVTAPSPSAAPASPDGAPKASRLEVTVGPVTADQGELPLGKLGQAKERYAKCIDDNGGLHGESGEVHVRFLVRSKGIAEGVSVQKRVNVSAEAARCVSEVVDRRHVGTPDEPLVGATVVVKFTSHP